MFQCRVYSKEQPSINWYKKVDKHVNNKRIDTDPRYLKYLNDTYALLQSGGDVHLGNDIYLSKLSLSTVAFKDVGYYVCVAISLHGFGKQEAYLSVEGADWWNMKVRRGGLGATVWLFFIPIVFVMLPILIWMCFWVHKNECKKKQLQLKQQLTTATTKVVPPLQTSVRSMTPVHRKHPRRVRYQKKAQPTVDSPYNLVVNVEIV